MGSELIQLLSQFFKFVVSVDDLADAFAGVALDLSAHRFVKLFFLPHGGEGVSGVIGRVFSDVALFVCVLQNSHISEQGRPIAISVLAVVGIEPKACAVSL